MRLTIGLVGVMVCVAAAYGQNQRGFRGPMGLGSGSVGNVVFPGGVAGLTGIDRVIGGGALPGSLSGPGIFTGAHAPGHEPSRLPFGPRQYGYSGGVFLPYEYPLFLGGFYDDFYPYSYPYSPSYAPNVSGTQPVNVTVIYPPLQAIPQPSAEDARSSQSTFSQTATPSGAVSSAASPEADKYLIVLKGRRVYGAVSYRVEGDTLHYFTPGNVDNPVPLSMVDRELTESLNKALGVDFHLQ